MFSKEGLPVPFGPWCMWAGTTSHLRASLLTLWCSDFLAAPGATLVGPRAVLSRATGAWLPLPRFQRTGSPGRVTALGLQLQKAGGLGRETPSG